MPVQNAWYRRHPLRQAHVARYPGGGRRRKSQSTRVRGCRFLPRATPLQLIRPFILNGLPNARAISQPFWGWWRHATPVPPQLRLAHWPSQLPAEGWMRPPPGGDWSTESGLRDGGWPLLCLTLGLASG